MNRREGERARTLNSVLTERIVLKGRRQAGGPAALEGLAGSWSPVQNFGLDLQPGLEEARAGTGKEVSAKSRQERGHLSLWLSCCLNPFSACGGHLRGHWRT